jgi:hypothetical protein
MAELGRGTGYQYGVVTITPGMTAGELIDQLAKLPVTAKFPTADMKILVLIRSGMPFTVTDDQLKTEEMN